MIIRDSKLIELREKIENGSPQTSFSQFAGRQIPFLFRVCQDYAFDFNKCLEAIRELESEVYLPLNKIAKELGLKESHQYMFDIFNQNDEPDLITSSAANDST